MEYILVAVVAAVAGFVAGALVYRRNAKKGEKIINELKRRLSELERK